MALLSLAMGTQAGLDDRAIEAGQILVTTDTARMYVDVSNTSRIALNANIAEKVKNTLKVQVNTVDFKSFDGSNPTTIDFAAGTNVTLSSSGNKITINAKDTTYSTLPNPHALTWGSKSYTGAAAETITLADFGLTNVLHFLGTTTTAIGDGNTTRTISVGGKSVTANSGDIVMYNGAEFIWTSSAWEKLGDEALWVPNTRTVTAGSKLTGGGDLSGNITISHATLDTVEPTSTSGLFVKNIITDDYGHVTQWENADCKNLSLQIAGTLQTTYDPFNAAATFNVPLMGAASTSEAGTTGLVPAPTKGAITRILAADGSWKSLAAGAAISISGLTITNAGVRSVTESATNGKVKVNTNGNETDVLVYTLPKAEDDVLGGVKIGSNITVNTDGVISITGNNVRTAMGAATGTNSGYLSSTDFTTFTNAANAVVWGTF